MKTLYLISFTLFIIVGCSGPAYPVPAELIKDCLDRGGQPEYFANQFKHQFDCKIYKQVSYQ